MIKSHTDLIKELLLREKKEIKPSPTNITDIDKTLDGGIWPCYFYAFGNCDLGYKVNYDGPISENYLDSFVRINKPKEIIFKFKPTKSAKIIKESLCGIGNVSDEHNIPIIMLTDIIKNGHLAGEQSIDWFPDVIIVYHEGQYKITKNSITNKTLERGINFLGGKPTLEDIYEG